MSILTDLVVAAAAVSGPASGIIFFFASRSAERRTREIVTEELGNLIAVKLAEADQRTRAVVNDDREKIKEDLGNLIAVKLAAFKGELNSPQGYRRSESCTLMMEPLEKRMADAEEQLETLPVCATKDALQELSEYAHEARHELNNSLHAVTLQLDRDHRRLKVLEDARARV